MIDSLKRLAKFCLGVMEFTVLLPFHLLELLTYFVAAAFLGGAVLWAFHFLCQYLGWPPLVAYAWGGAVALYRLSTKLYERYFSGGGEQ
jgi:hypothetical protein